MRSSALIEFIAVLLLCTTSPPAAWAKADESLVELRDALLGPWTRVRTAHFRVHSDHRTPLDKYQLDMLEASFGRIADGLRIPSRVREEFESSPIEFYYTHRHAVLERLGGRDAEGLAFAAHRVIVSLRLPHAHEVAHVLLHISSGARSTRSTPLLQEGLATWWGGTADAAANVVLENGRDVVRARRARIDDLLTADRMADSVADSHDLYALAALFCEYLRQRHSMSTLVHLLALLSDEGERLSERPARASQVQFEGLEGRPWQQIVRDFEEWSVHSRFGGIDWTDLPEDRPVAAVSEQDHQLRWWVEGRQLVVAVDSRQGRPVDAELLWGDPLPDFDRSDRQQPTWRRWGLRISPEAVVFTDHLARRQMARLSEPVSGAARATGRQVERVLRLNLGDLPAVGMPKQVEFFVSPRVQLPALADPRSRVDH